MKSTVSFWNIWGHRFPTEIHETLSRHRSDIHCLTEVTCMGHQYDPRPRIFTSTDPNEPPISIDGREQLVEEFGAEYTIVYATAKLAPWQCKKKPMPRTSM